MATMILDGRQVRAVTRTAEGIFLAFDPLRAMSNMLEERYCRIPRPVTRMLPFHYHRLSCQTRFRLGRISTQASLALKRGTFPQWPIEPCVEALRLYLLPFVRIPMLKPWKGYAAVLTHDIDCAEGYAGAKHLAKIEADYGVRSTWFAVCGDEVIQRHVLDGLAAEGHEIACHDVRHDNKIAYLPRGEITARLEQCAKQLGEYSPVGFRSPSKGRTDVLFEILPEFFAYDSSIPDTDGFAGCCTIFPFRRGGILELPMTMPLDATVLLRGYPPSLAYSVWMRKLEWIKALGGMAVITTHPEPHFSGRRKMLRAYELLLHHLRADVNARILTMKELYQLCSRHLKTSTSPPQ